MTSYKDIDENIMNKIYYTEKKHLKGDSSDESIKYSKKVKEDWSGSICWTIKYLGLVLPKVLFMLSNHSSLKCLSTVSIIAISSPSFTK